MSVDTLAVVLLTYKRFEYARRTIEAARKYLTSSEHALYWHIASDGDDASYCDKLAALLPDGSGRSNSYRGGYGKNYNVAMQTVHPLCPWSLLLEDDWELLRPFNVDDMIRDMAELDIGCARMGYLGYTQELRGHLVWGENCGHWLVFDPGSPEPHVFAGHPRIEARDWSRNVGPWPEGILPGETEFTVAHRWAARLRVGWPLDVVRPSGDLWAHIGTTRSY